MPEPQAIIQVPTESAIILVATVNEGAETTALDLLADASGLKRSVGFRLPEGDLSCVVGIGAALWDRLYPGLAKPVGLHPFAEIAGPVHTAVATPGDLLFHIRAHRLDLCFELAQRIMERLTGAVAVVDEVHGFRSFDERDLLGFVDGTENPEGEAAADAVIVGEGDPGYAGSSYVLVQKYLHDLPGWDALTVEQQEQAIGRSKLSDIEMPDDVKPPDSHVALTVIEDETGSERQIMRFNMPFGTVGPGEYGTYFIGYAREPGVIEQMLRNMFLGDGTAAHDRILDFSTAITGTLFFVPTIEFLEDPPVPATSDEATAPPAANRGAASSSGPGQSLGIGSLRG